MHFLTSKGCSAGNFPSASQRKVGTGVPGIVGSPGLRDPAGLLPRDPQLGQDGLLPRTHLRLLGPLV